MNDIEKVVTTLQGANVVGQLWVDGSFVTEKLDPKDVDVALRFDAVWYHSASQNQQAAVQWLNQNVRKIGMLCDSYTFPKYPRGHQLHAIGEYLYAYWLKQFGFSRSAKMKGIPFVRL